MSNEKNLLSTYTQMDQILWTHSTFRSGGVEAAPDVHNVSGHLNLNRAELKKERRD